ncbi:MAG TPA: site-specific integrase [Terracidiphilus sp.]|nr:site-specific integrase [Terracidiphilus sp.]
MEVNVTKRIETQTGSRYCPVVVNSSGRIKSDWVIVNGNQERHPEGSYYLEWREKGQRKRLSVGKDAVVAFNSQVRKVKELEARAEGLEVQLPKDDPNRAQLRSAMADFLKEIKLSRKDKTWRGYKVAFAYFQQSCSKKCADELERIDLLEFVAFLREKKKLAPRTVFNKFTCVMTFLESQGIPKLLGKNDKPRFVETEVAIFEDNQLTDLYPVCTLYHRTLYDFLLMTGFREQEAMHITWQNIRFKANIVEMRWKPQFDWSPKAYKEREVPVPDELLESLEAYRKTLSEKRAALGALVFSTRSGKCDTHMIRALKRNATKARLNPNDFWLHKFRATFATTHLRAGVDLKTVMAWMGQTTMDSIIRYLKPARKDEVISKVNLSFTGPTFADRKKLNCSPPKQTA